MKLINLTNHTIHEVTTGTIIPTSGIVARVKTSNEKLTILNGIPVYRTTLSEVEGLPKPEDNTIYIVSAMVLNKVSKSRTDVVSPGNPQRKNGIVSGCMGFRQL